ncbi:MAG: cytochrome P450 [Anaerolineaceae bacterium]|nr:cytochrome P450 [Anaerolineaceae bacterium]
MDTRLIPTTKPARARSTPPGPKSAFPLTLLAAFRRDPVNFLLEMASYGDISYVYLNKFNMYLLNDPDLIQDVLVTHARQFIKSRGLQFTRPVMGNGLLTSEGDYHLRQRRLVQPAFHRQRVAGYAKTMVEYAEGVNRRWQPQAVVDMTSEMMRLTLGIAGKTLFNADVAGEADEIGLALTDAMQMFKRMTSPFEGILEKLPLASNARFERGRQRLDETIYRMIGEHRASGDNGDLLSMLLAAEDVEGDGARMTDQQIRDEAMTIFLAGHETTAIALGWSWYLLSQAPQAEEQLQQELSLVLGGRLPTYEDIPALDYTRMVFSEALRMYPPAYVLGRSPLSDYKVGGYVIPAGATVLLSPFVMQHDPRYYSEPYKFDPLRWKFDEEAARPKYAYFPFGGGPRLCVGEPFAWAEGILVLATLAQTWRPRYVPDHPIGFKPLITLRPKGGISMRLERRA